MPAPKADDPFLCTRSNTLLDESCIQHGWVVCPDCQRVLKPTQTNILIRMHRIRSRTTDSLDKVRDSLLAYGIAPP
jgi:hypothetical protein